jgi:transcriptional regulator GlxA family with amidase domain
MAKISFLAADGCGFSGTSGIIDCLSIAGVLNAGKKEIPEEPLFETEIITPDKKPVQMIGGYRISGDKSFADLETTDMIIIPPFLPNTEILGYESNDVLNWITACYEKGIQVATLCTGTFVLAETGLLDGRLATTNWLYTQMFRRRFPKVRLKPDRILTRDKGLICSGTVSAFYNLALHIIETYGSSDLAARCAKVFLVDPSRTSQASYAIFNVNKNHGDEEILRAQEWMEEHLSETVSMENLARHVGISPRHFIRRFKKATGESPLSYLQQLRIETAKSILETRPETVDGITRSIGYENTSTFCKLFKKYTGLSPREYREKFFRGLNPNPV